MYTVLHRQYYACWCSGNFRSQGMSKHGIDPESQNILSPASEELISLQTQVMKSLRQYMKINISEKKINLPQAHVSFSCPVLSADLHMECTVRDMSAWHLTLEDIGSNILCVIFKHQALTTPRKIRLPIGQPAGKNQVAPIKNQVAPPLPSPIVNKKVFEDSMTHSKIKWNIHGIRSIENNEKKLYFRTKR